MTVTDIWFDVYWKDLTECARARVFATLLSAGIQIPDSVIESREQAERKTMNFLRERLFKMQETESE